MFHAFSFCNFTVELQIVQPWFFSLTYVASSSTNAPNIHICKCINVDKQTGHTKRFVNYISKCLAIVINTNIISLFLGFTQFRGIKHGDRF